MEKVIYYDGSVELEASIVYPKMEGLRPIVFIFPSWEGKGAFAEYQAQELANMGYIGCALDPYGKGRIGTTRQECADLMGPFMQDRMRLQHRVLACQSLLPKIRHGDTTRVGAIGFCFGGLCALDALRAGAAWKGVVSFHGLLEKPQGCISQVVSSKILILHGHLDPMVSMQDVELFLKEMHQADVQIHIFNGAMHAFTNPEANTPALGTLFHEMSSHRAFSLMKMFFSEIF